MRGFLCYKELMMFILFILFLLLEIAGFVIIGDEIGVFLTLVWLFLSAYLGLNLVKRGLALMAKSKFDGTASSSDTMFHAVGVFLSGVLLIIPGFFSDFLGILLMVPLFRTVFKGFILDGLLAGFTFGFVDTDDLKDMKENYREQAEKGDKISHKNRKIKKGAVDADFDVVDKKNPHDGV